MATSVEQFMQLAPQLISEAAAYSAKAQSDPETEGNIRQLRTMTAALQAALMSVPVRFSTPSAQTQKA